MLIENQFLPAPTQQMLDKYLQNIDLKGRQIISLPGAPTCLGSVLSEAHTPSYLVDTGGHS
jgi:hypothetical protein